MKAQHSTEDALIAAMRCLRNGMPSLVIKHYLIQDGFDPRKANVILRWAYQATKKELNDGNRTQTY